MTAVKRLGRSRLAALVGLTPSLRSVVLEQPLTTLPGLSPRLVDWGCCYALVGGRSGRVV